MEVPAGLREAAERKLGKLAAFLDPSGWVEVGFVEEKNPRIAGRYHCEIVAHVRGRRLKVEGSATEPYAALEVATERVEKQVRRLKDKRVTRRHRGEGYGANSRGPGNPGHANPAPGEDDAAPRPSPQSRPRIVEVSVPDAKPMTPAEAAVQLDLADEPFLLFVNAETNRAAVIYRLSNGDYGLKELPA